MTENSICNVRRGKPVVAKYLAFCAVALLNVSIVLPSSTLAADKSSAESRAKVGKITIQVDPRVELISVVCRLAGYPEYNDGTLRPYAKAIEKHFGDCDDHPVIKMAATLRYTRSMSCDGPMSLAVHIDDNYRLRKTIEPWPSTLDTRWNQQETEEFLEKLQHFAAESKFDEFFKTQGPIYEQGIRPCASVIGQKKVTTGQPGVVFERILGADLGEWLADFFGKENTGDLKLVLGFVNGFANYGPRFEDGLTSEKYAIVGMRPFDPSNTVIFLPQQIEAVAHEFCHSFANPVVDKYMDRLQPTGQMLFAAQGPAMRMRGYQKWESVMYETAVRACVASFIDRCVVDSRFADYYLDREARHGFTWTGHMSEVLKTYENNRDKYPTFDSFFPEFATCLNEHSKEL